LQFPAVLLDDFAGLRKRENAHRVLGRQFQCLGDINPILNPNYSSSEVLPGTNRRDSQVG
jgi:hypothetical protein